MRFRSSCAALVALAALSAAALAGCGASEGDDSKKDASVDKLSELAGGLKDAGFKCEKPRKPNDDDNFSIGGEEPLEVLACAKGDLEYEVARWRSAAVADESMAAALGFVCGFGAGSFDYVDGGNWIGALNSSNTDSDAKKEKQALALKAAAEAAGIKVTTHKCASKKSDGDPFGTGDDEEDEPSGPGTSRTDPVDVGESMTLGDYEVTITEIEPDATEALKTDSDYFNEPSKGQYMLVGLDVTYQGDDEGQPLFDVNVVLSGSDRVQYEDCQVSLKDEDTPTLEEGGKASYHACVDAPPEAIDGGVLLVKVGFGDEDRGYWKIPA